MLPKPIETGDNKLAEKFSEFLRRGKNFSLIEISFGIAETAGKLRGLYPALRTIDAIQLSAAIGVRADAFLTNDKRLRQIKEIRVLVLEDYLTSKVK